MPTIDPRESVAALLVEHPGLSEVLEEYGVDYCCGGHRSLEDACQEAGVSCEELLQRLSDALAQGAGSTSEPSPATLSPDRLCDHIVERHHQYLRRALPRLAQLMEKTVQAHASNHPELHELARVFGELRAELEQHMMKEEMVLFPAIKQLAASTSAPEFPFGTVRNPIAVMEDEHDRAAHALRRMRELTAGYAVPDDACPTYRELLHGLAQLERDLHQHIHKENNILFRAVIDMEQRLRTNS